MLQYRAIWNMPGGPGYSVMHAREVDPSGASEISQSFANAVRQLFTTYGTAGLPDDLTITFDAEVLQINPSNGELEQVYAVTPPSAVTGTGTTGYARPSGARIDWATDAIVSGRRLRGRTYMVPILASGYESNGTLTSSVMTALNNAADAYLAAANIPTALSPAVWSRPVWNRDADGRRTTLARPGLLADITGRSVTDRVSVLRTRRD